MGSLTELQQHSLILGLSQERGFGIVAEKNSQVGRFVKRNRLAESAVQAQKMRETEGVIIRKVRYPEATFDVGDKPIQKSL